MFSRVCGSVRSVAHLVSNAARTNSVPLFLDGSKQEWHRVRTKQGGCVDVRCLRLRPEQLRPLLPSSNFGNAAHWWSDGVEERGGP